MTSTATRSRKSRQAARSRSSSLYDQLYRAQVMERICLIKIGVPAADAKLWLNLPMLGRNLALKALDLPVATFNKKVKANAKLTPAESERVVGFARLVGQVETLVQDAGTVPDFDAQAWLARWLTEPLPALGNAKPIDFLDTMEGQALVSQKLALVASGAYA